MLKSIIIAEFGKSVKQKGTGTYKIAPPLYVQFYKKFIELLERESLI